MGQQSREGVKNIGRGERRTVGKAHTLAQVKGIGAPVVRDVPALGQLREDLGFPVGIVLHPHQAIEHILGDGLVDRGTLEIHRVRLVLNGNKIRGGA